MSAGPERVDVAIIGAGPSGAVAAALLRRQGHGVLVLEREAFPRFVIGESLLPQCMTFLDQAGMLPVLAGRPEFQLKNGAAFRCAAQHTTFDFSQKFTAGPAATYQVPRGIFDQLLAEEAARQGAMVRHRHQVTVYRETGDRACLAVQDETGRSYNVAAKFVLDASGFGRVLPRLLELEYPSAFPVRQALFTHVEDRITDPGFDRDKILITVHPRQRDVWYWLIPFGNGRSSLGVVGEPAFFNALGGSHTDQLWTVVRQAVELGGLLDRASVVLPARSLVGYSANVSRFAGPRFALLGNAAEFLDPVFSSGVTIALKSAVLAAAALDAQLRGQPVDWQAEYVDKLRVGIRTFRTFVQAWYDGRLQDIIFYPDQRPEVRGMVCSILAGYAWDQQNPYVAESERRINTLARLCRSPASAVRRRNASGP